MIWICIMEVDKTIKIDLYIYHLLTNDQRPNHLHIFLCKILNKFSVWLQMRFSNWFLVIFSNEFCYQIRKSLIDLFFGHRKRLHHRFHKLFHFPFETMWCPVWHRNLFDNPIKSTVCHLIHMNDCKFFILLYSYSEPIIQIQYPVSSLYDLFANSILHRKWHFSFPRIHIIRRFYIQFCMVWSCCSLE